MLNFTKEGHHYRVNGIKVSPCFKELYEKLKHIIPHKRFAEYLRLHKEAKLPCMGAQYTLDEIALLYGISKESVRQIEAKSKKKLKHPKLSNKLREYYFA